MRQYAIFLPALAVLTCAAGAALAAASQASPPAPSQAQPQAKAQTRFETLSLSAEQMQALAQQTMTPPMPAGPEPQIASLDKLPADIRAELGEEVADRGKPFAAGCVGVNGEAHSRFSGGRIEGDTASVTIERGGIAHYFETLEFRRSAGRWVKVQVPATTALPPPA